MSFIKDPCGIVCILITYSAILYADYVVTQWIVLDTMPNSLWGPINVVLFNTIIFLLTLSHLKAVFCDPGLVPLARLEFSDFHAARNNEHLYADEDWTVCTRCETYRPPRAHHCRICKRCIRYVDDFFFSENCSNFNHVFFSSRMDHRCVS